MNSFSLDISPSEKPPSFNPPSNIGSQTAGMFKINHLKLNSPKTQNPAVVEAQLAKAAIKKQAQAWVWSDGKREIQKSSLTGEQKEVFEQANVYVQNHDQDQLKRLLGKTSNRKIVLALVDELLRLNRDRSTYEFIIKVIERVYPKVSEMFVADGPIADTPPSDKGTQWLIKYLEEKKSFLDDFKCIFHENHTDFEKKVEALQKDESQQNVRIGFIVRAKQQCCGEDSTHLTPIYVEKKDGITNCVIIDSIGKNQTYESNCSIRLNSLGIVPYVYTGRRQTDSTSCFVYALRDMVEISKNRFFLDSVITSAAKYNEKAPRTELDFSKHFFNDLPPNMMKGAQSLTMLYEYNQNYEEENQTQHPVVTTTKDREGKSLQDFIKRNVEEDKNLYAFRRSRKYARLLILEAIKMSSE